MKTTFSTLFYLLLAIGSALAQGVLEARLSGSILGGPASFVAGIGYFRVVDNTVDYRLAVYDWGSFTLPSEQVAELLSGSGLLRIQFSGGPEVQGAVTSVPEPSSMLLLAAGLLWMVESKRRTAQPAGCTERRDRVSIDNETSLAWRR